MRRRLNISDVADGVTHAILAGPWPGELPHVDEVEQHPGWPAQLTIKLETGQRVLVTLKEEGDT